MKITVESTSKVQAGTDTRADCQPADVSVEHPYDDLNLQDALDLVVTPALRAFGYSLQGLVVEEDEDGN